MICITNHDRNNLRLNRNRYILKENEVKYLGILISPEGKKTDPERIPSILSIDTPKSLEL